MNCTVFENVSAPGLPIFIGRDLVKRENRGVSCEAAGCMWAVAMGYEHNLEITKDPKTY